MTEQVWLRIYGQDPATDSAKVSRGGALRVAPEQAMARLEQLPRMFVEPDGSFLWSGVSADDATAAGATAAGANQRSAVQWQLEGTVYDDGQVVRYIELRGQCPLACWHEFLAAFDESFASIVLELLDQNQIVDGQWLYRQHPDRQHPDRQHPDRQRSDRHSQSEN